MDSLKDLGAKDVVQILQDFYGQSMLEMANRPSIAPFNATTRNETYYAKQVEPVIECCEHCGRPFDGQF